MSLLLHASVFKVGEESPERPAIRTSSGVVNYGELSAKTQGFGRWLRLNGNQTGSRVVVCLPKSPQSVAAQLAVLAAGSAYVPLDQHIPAARLRNVLEQVDPSWLICTPAVAERLNDAPTFAQRNACGILTLSPTAADLDQLPQAPTTGPGQVHVDPNDLAAILFTSGSTGVAKGVMLSHRNIASFVSWAIATFKITKDDRLTSHAPFYFDLSTLDLFGAFSSGASVYLLGEADIKFPAFVSQILERERATIWYSVPTALRRLVENGGLDKRGLDALRLILFAGEVYPVPDLRRLMRAVPNARFCNLYGPTETNVCTYHFLDQVPDESVQAIPIGKPCEQVEISIRDENGAPAPIGEAGEICVRGPTVMLGYWRQQELTHASRLPGQADTYRTGGFGRWQQDGAIEFLGRRDRLVKVGGYRIELGEIESALLACPEIKEAVALVSAGNEQTLVAAIVAAEGAPDPERAGYLACAERLPTYARPSRIFRLDALPLLDTGKLDRRALHARLAALDLDFS
jgi:amino acid adenylation domain-containing protein